MQPIIVILFQPRKGLTPLDAQVSKKRSVMPEFSNSTFAGLR